MSVSPLYVPQRRARRVIPPMHPSYRPRTVQTRPATQPRTPCPEFRQQSPLDSTRAFLEWLWSWRACAICEAFGVCPHREPEVDIARGEAWARRLGGHAA
jgi:hypothetical protein